MGVRRDGIYFHPALNEIVSVRAGEELPGEGIWIRVADDPRLGRTSAATATPARS